MKKIAKKLCQIACSFTMLYLVIALIIGIDNANIMAKAIIQGLFSWIK